MATKQDKAKTGSEKENIEPKTGSENTTPELRTGAEPIRITNIISTYSEIDISAIMDAKMGERTVAEWMEHVQNSGRAFSESPDYSEIQTRYEELMLLLNELHTIKVKAITIFHIADMKMKRQTHYWTLQLTENYKKIGKRAPGHDTLASLVGAKINNETETRMFAAIVLDTVRELEYMVRTNLRILDKTYDITALLDHNHNNTRY